MAFVDDYSGGMSNAPTIRRWFRFRLSTLFILAVLAALLVAQITSTLRVRRVEAHNQALAAENKALRAEAGHLTIADRSKVAVIAVPEIDELTWRWKVWLPKGTWTMHAATEGISTTGLARSSCTLPSSGDTTVNVAASVRKSASGDWQRIVSFGGAEVRSSLSGDHALVASMRSTQLTSAGRAMEDVFDPKDPVVLLRLRAFKNVETSPGTWTSPPPSTAPADGFMVWFEKTGP
jgi:hypothetical protein